MGVESTARNSQILKQSAGKYENILALISELSLDGLRGSSEASGKISTDGEAKIKKMQEILQSNRFQIELLRSLLS